MPRVEDLHVGDALASELLALPPSEHAARSLDLVPVHPPDRHAAHIERERQVVGEANGGRYVDMAVAVRVCLLYTSDAADE